MKRPILIVSKNEGTRQLISRALQRAGFSTVQAEEIGIALNMMRFDCIGTTVFDVSVSPEDWESLIETLERRTSPVHLVYLDCDPLNLDHVVRACVHSAMQRGIGRVYSVVDSLVVSASRGDTLAKLAGATKQKSNNL